MIGEQGGQKRTGCTGAEQAMMLNVDRYISIHAKRPSILDMMMMYRIEGCYIKGSGVNA